MHLPRKDYVRDCPMSPVSRPAAFTLIELLVVIAIIAILAALSVPVVSGMLDRGADVADMSNLRQIGTAIGQFAAENGGRFPNATTPVPGAPTSDGTGRSSFMENVDRYFPPDSKFSQSSIYNWPRRPLWYSKRFAKMPEGQTYPKSQYYWGTAWGMNTHVFYNSGSANMNNFKGYIIKVPSLAKLVIVGEKNRSGGHDFIPAQAPVFERNVQAQYRVSRGSGGNKNHAFYLFGDFHIESIVGDQSSAAHPEYNSYNPTNRLYYRW